MLLLHISHANTCGSVLVDSSLSNLMSLLQGPQRKPKKDVRRKELARGEFALAELVQNGRAEQIWDRYKAAWHLGIFLACNGFR